jgi:transmembrane protein EpsG
LSSFSYQLYISIFLIAAIFSYIAEYGNELSLRTSARFIVFFAMLLPSMLRYDIGVDYGSYVELYLTEYKKTPFMEPGFKYFSILLHRMAISPWLYMGIISGITYGILCFFIPKKHFFTIIVFYILSYSYLWSYNAIRQYLAGSLLLLSLNAYFHDRKIKSFTLLGIASSIHFSSLIALPIILFSNIRINRTIRFFLIIFIVVFLSSGDVLLSILRLFILISPRYVYLISLLTERTKINTGLQFLILSLPSILIILNSRNIEKQNNGNFLLNINTAYFMIILFAYLFTAFARVYTAMIFISLFSIELLYASNKKYRKIYHYLLFLSFFALFVRLIPKMAYKSIFFNASTLE